MRVWRSRDKRDDFSTCAQVLKVLQSYIDGETDELTAYRVAAHLEACRNCGLEFKTFSEIKMALRGLRRDVDRSAVERLREFVLSLQ
jgi:anti-sigma factor RsiW